MPDTLPTDRLLAECLAVLGPAGVLTEPADIAPSLSDWRSLYQGRAMAVLRPASTEQVAACVKACGCWPRFLPAPK